MYAAPWKARTALNKPGQFTMEELTGDNDEVALPRDPQCRPLSHHAEWGGGGFI